jgi:hypothetical protein
VLAWVEDNRRKVEELSKGKLGYVWVPNTGGSGFNSFNRYYFAQQDKEGAVIEKLNTSAGLHFCQLLRIIHFAIAWTKHLSLRVHPQLLKRTL